MITVSRDVEYKRLVWNTLFGIGTVEHNGSMMLDKECHVAQRVLEWLDEHPEHKYYRDLIKEIPYTHFAHLESTNTLYFNLWRATNASLWLSTRDASSHRDLLWTLAIMRLSCFLNTGEWQPPNLNTPARA